MIESDDVQIGVGAVIEPGVLIRADKVRIGDYAYIGQNTRVIVPEFSLGEYSKLNADTFCGGTKPLQIGRHCYIGAKVRLDSRGGLDIDDNVGIGDHSQLWTHIKHGDTVEGCRFENEKYMYVGKDAWLVGHVLVSPVTIEEKAMALLGSVITHDMKFNHVYAGVPAKDITDKVGMQFEPLTWAERLARMWAKIWEFEALNPAAKDLLKAVTLEDEYESGVTCFDVNRRVYTKQRTEVEVAFIRWSGVKFAPAGEGAWVKREALCESAF